MPKNTTLGGRPRTTNEQLFTQALMEQLDRERERRSLDQRSFASFLNLSESLLSLYRSGQRLPSFLGMLDMDTELPGLFGRVVAGYYRLARERDIAERMATKAPDEAAEEDDQEQAAFRRLLATPIHEERYPDARQPGDRTGVRI